MLTRRSLRFAAYVILVVSFGALLVLDTTGHRSNAAATTCLLVGDAALVALLISDARGRRRRQTDKRRDAAYYSAKRHGATATKPGCRRASSLRGGTLHHRSPGSERATPRAGPSVAGRSFGGTSDMEAPAHLVKNWE